MTQFHKKIVKYGLSPEVSYTKLIISVEKKTNFSNVTVFKNKYKNVNLS